MKKLLLVSFLVYSTLAADTNTTKEALSLRDKITDNYHTLLNTIDCFFTDYDDINQTNYKKISQNELRIIFSIKNTKNNPLKTDLYLKANIKLPQIQNRLEITLNKQTLSNIDNQNRDTNYERTLEDKMFRIGIKYYFYKKRYSAIYTNLDFRFQSPFGLYWKIGAKKSYFYYTLQTILGSEFYYYLNNQNLTTSATITFFKPLSDAYSVQQRNEILWSDEKQATKLQHTLRAYHYINSNNRLQYQLSYATIDDKKCDYCQDWYGANIKFHHNIKKWLFFEIIPQIYKRRENSFIFEKALTLNFGILFSK